MSCTYCDGKFEQLFRYNSNGLYINVCFSCLGDLGSCDICKNSDVNKLGLFCGSRTPKKDDMIILACETCSNKLFC